MSINKILVPLDGSELARKALPTAMSIARRSDAQLCLVTIATDKPGDLGSSDSDPYLEAISRSIVESGIPCDFHVTTGTAAEGIVRIAEDEHADLIVMTTRGRSGITRGILGSVTDEVISESSVPVYVTRADNLGTDVGGNAYDSGVIVPLDGSELATNALDDAIQLAKSLVAPLYLLRVIEADSTVEENVAAQAYLERISARLAKRKVFAIPELLSGHPGESIIRSMSNHPGSIVVMSTRGSGGLIRWVRGSVSDWLIQRAPGPVVVSPRQKELLGSVIH